MAPKLCPKCIRCGKTETMMWRITANGHICQQCYVYNTTSNNRPGEERKLRKSTRAARNKQKITPAVKSAARGRNRRCNYKKTAMKKRPTIASKNVAVHKVLHQGSYMQSGDIVSLMDAKDNIYYAQIRGFIVNFYCEKSAYITWLIPTQSSPPPNEGFDPSTYLIGPDEDIPRSISLLEFVMHAPSDYYHDKSVPLPQLDQLNYELGQPTKTKTAYIWTRLLDNKQGTLSLTKCTTPPATNSLEN